MPEELKQSTTIDDAINAAADKVFSENERAEESHSEQSHDEKPETKSKDRDDSGKFAKKSSSGSESADDNDVKADEGSDEKQAPTATAETQTAASSAPSSWSAPAKALWGSLPAEIRAEALRLDKETQGVLQQHAGQRKQWETIEKVIEPRRQALLADYGSVDTGLNTLFNLSEFANKDPYGFVSYFAQRRGLDLATLTKSSGAAQQQQVSPEIAALQQELATVKNGLQESKQVEQQRINQAVDQSFNEFAKTNPPHFKEVSQDMAAILESGMARTFAEAYDKAVWARPDIREKMLEEQRNAALETSRKEAEKKAKEAKKIVSTNVATRAFNGSASTPKRSLDDTITAAANSLMG